MADDATAYFCKLKRGVFDDTSVEIPRLLSEQGIAQIIPPRVTKIGQLRAALDEFNWPNGAIEIALKSDTPR